MPTSVESFEARVLPAVNLVFDYSLDTNNFFDPASFPERRTLLETAGEQFSNRLADQLSAIQPGGQNSFGGTDAWTAVFTHPSTGAAAQSVDLTVPEGTLHIFVGARQLGASLGMGGPGGFSIQAADQEWIDLVAGRGQAGALSAVETDFGPWGGSLSFDVDAAWHFGETTDGLNVNESDFLSVAVHELGHLLGVGTAESWDNQVSAGTFTGSQSVAEYDGAGNVPLHGDLAHWASGLTDGGQETAMDPSITNGTRKLLTALDYAGLSDIGWDVRPVTQVISVANGSGHTIVIEDDGDPNNGRTRVTIDGSNVSTFLNPLTSLVIDGADGADVITLVSLDAGFAAPIVVNGHGGNDTLTASAIGSAVTLQGGDGNDSVVGGAGHDLLNGENGDDTLRGGAGNDTLYGASDRDSLDGGAGNDRVKGQGSSSDSVSGGPGDDTLDGGPGTDWLVESADVHLILTDSQLTGLGSDAVIGVERAVLSGGPSANAISAALFSGSTTLLGAAGNDSLTGGAGSDVLNGEDDDDRLIGSGGNDTLLGASGRDFLDGGVGNDQVKGQGSSSDSLTGGAGNDTLDGGSGTDFIFESGDVNFLITNSLLTGLGADSLVSVERANLTGGVSANSLDAGGFSGAVTLIGGAGHDTLSGGPSDDSIVGGDGDDAMVTGAGNDHADGGDGHDSIRGGDGHDTLLGGAGDDTLNGGSGNDSLLSGIGNDGLSGWTGEDFLNGDSGADTLVGGDGNDTLLGSSGDDIALGGAGADVVNGQGGSHDTVAGGSGLGSDPGDNIVALADEIDESFQFFAAWIEAV